MRDAVAVIETLRWLDEKAPGSVTETQVVTRLEENRRKDNALQDISFDTIAGTGPNGAIMHYRVTEETDSQLENGHILVLDSGGQYLDAPPTSPEPLPLVTSEQRRKPALPVF